MIQNEDKVELNYFSIAASFKVSTTKILISSNNHFVSAGRCYTFLRCSGLTSCTMVSAQGYPYVSLPERQVIVSRTLILEWAGCVEGRKLRQRQMEIVHQLIDPSRCTATNAEWFPLCFETSHCNSYREIALDMSINAFQGTQSVLSDSSAYYELRN